MIHKYKLNGFNIVIDINSGAVHVLDNCSFDMISYFEDKIEDNISNNIKNDLLANYSEKEIDESHSELLNLYNEGLIFSEEADYSKFLNLSDSPIKSMCLNVAHDCNLCCEYCFASKGDFGGNRELMSLDVGKMAIDFLIEKSGSRHNLEVDFFGGEPLMNFDVVKQIVEYARSIEKDYNKNFRFTITTNGLLLDDEKIDFINKEMSNVVLSIDGRPEVNDRLRKTVNGKGSYSIIVPKFQKLVAGRKNKDYYTRGTFTKYNMDFANDVLHLADLGFDQISVEPVVSDSRLDYSIREEDLPIVFKEYERLANVILERRKNNKGFNFFHFMIDLNQGPCVIKRLRGCGCGNEYIAVTPNGDIYPCHQFVGDKKFKMGNLKENNFNNDLKLDFSRTNIYTKPDCKNCWAKFYCSGGCAANSNKYENDIRSSHKISCELEKKRIECAIMLIAAREEA